MCACVCVFPPQGREGEIRHLFRGFAFLHCKKLVENGGMFVCKTRHLVLAGGSKVSTLPAPRPVASDSCRPKWFYISIVKLVITGFQGFYWLWRELVTHLSGVLNDFSSCLNIQGTCLEKKQEHRAIKKVVTPPPVAKYLQL